MFSPNCVVAVPSPELSIKSTAVRSFMLKKLHAVMEMCLAHSKVSYAPFITLSSRIIIKTNNPKDALASLRDCFGINSIAVAQSMSFSSLDDLSKKAVELSDGIITKGTFAVRGKSFVDEFSSKELEIALGSSLIGAHKVLKVNLSAPKNELHCIVHKENAFFYFNQVQGAMGMPVGSQGKAGLLVNVNASKKDTTKVAKDILKVGCSLAIISNNLEKISLLEIESSNGFRNFKCLSVEQAIESYKTRKLLALFSLAKNAKEAEADSALLGTKVFAPLLI